jgi:hypothetical protein
MSIELETRFTELKRSSRTGANTSRKEARRRTKEESTVKEKPRVVMEKNFRYWD